MPTAIGNSTPTNRRRLEDSDEARSTAPRRQTAAQPSISAGVAHRIDADLAVFVANSTRPPSNDQVLFIGVNPPSVDDETRALRSAGARCRRLDASSGDVVEGHDLATAEGRRAFVSSLGVPPNVGADIEVVLAATSTSERATIGRLARVWSEGERGGSVPSRLVVSGHSGSGEQIWSSGNHLNLADVCALAAAMPRAAAQIEDLHVSACWSNGNARDVGEWRSAFPGLKSVWAYHGSAPSPAGAHLAAWARMTTGRRESIALSPALLQGRVALWSAGRGYEDAGVSIDKLRTSAPGVYARLTGYLDGATRVTDPHEPGIEGDYHTVRDLSTRPGISKAEAERARIAAEQLLRVRYYESGVRGAFASAHGALVARAYRELGLPAPDFASLTRREALVEIGRFEQALAAIGPRIPTTAAEATRVLHGLASLDPAVIDEKWCVR